jgi:hypothetical protein
MPRKQTDDGDRGDVGPGKDESTAFGAQKPNRHFRSIAEETAEMEESIAREVGCELVQNQPTKMQGRSLAKP